MNAIHEAIDNLEKTRAALEKYSITTENYNLPYMGYLEEISWEMYKMSNDLKKIGDFYA